MRVVVTGGAGFLGSHLCQRLLDDGCQVLALDNFVTGTPANVAHLLERDGFVLRRYDVTEYLHVAGPVDAVLHFASPASPLDYLRWPIETLKVGSTGTLHALGLAKDKGARFLLASTSETYGDPQVHPQPETYWGHVNPVGPRGVYDEAKRYAEALTMAYRRTHDVDTGILRIFNSVLGGESLVYDDGVSLHRTTAEQLAARLGLPQGGGAVPLHGWSVPAHGPGGMEPASTTWFVGHPPTGDCFEVRTRYGRSVRVTADHSLFTRGPDGAPLATPVSRLQPGDHVALPASLPVPERDRASVDLLEVVADHDPWEVALSWDGLSDVLEARAAELVGLLAARSGRTRQSCWGTVTRWRDGLHLPVACVQALDLEVPTSARVRLARSKTWFPRTVALTDELLWVMGLWVAEGVRVETGTKSSYVEISCDDDTLDRAQKILERDLGTPVVRRAAASGVTPSLLVHSRLLLRLLDHLGFVQGDKCLPGWVLGLPLRRLALVLKGYQEGDGLHSERAAAGAKHEFSTVSTSLKDDLVVALGRFGLVASVGHYETSGPRGVRCTFWRLTLSHVVPWDPAAWAGGVRQALNARKDDGLVWARVADVVPVEPTPLVYDFVVPDRENFVAGTGLLAHNTHGPRMRPDDGRAIPAFTTQALRGEPLTVAGDGSQTRSVQYVDDLVEGVVRFLHSGHPGPVNIGNPHETSVLHIAETVLRLTGSSSPLTFVPRPEDDPSVRQPDIALAREVLGWEPQVGFEDGLGRTVAWFREHLARG